MHAYTSHGDLISLFSLRTEEKEVLIIHYTICIVISFAFFCQWKLILQNVRYKVWTEGVSKMKSVFILASWLSNVTGT